MVTVRQLERLWRDAEYAKMFALCVELRPEASPRLTMAMGRALPAAAMAIIRLEELGQAGVALCGKLIHTLLSAQEPDGGWGDPMTTTLCLRALISSNGKGLSIEAGMAYLAALQKDDGSWPAAPVRRLPADAYTTAFIVYHLGTHARFEQIVRAEDARRWLQAQEEQLDTDTARLWHSIRRWRRARTTIIDQPAVSWS